MENTTYIPLGSGNFDINKVRFSDIKIYRITKRARPFNVTRIYVNYAYTPGKFDHLRIEGEQGFTWGFKPYWPMEMLEENQTRDNIEGWETSVPLTNMDNIHEPTENQKSVIDIFDQLYETAYQYLLSKTDDPNMPGSSKLFLRSGPQGLKYPYAKSYTKVPKDGKDPIEIPPKLYCKLITYSKNPSNTTRIYGPGNRLCPPAKYEGKKGWIKPVWWVQSIFLGSHGDKEIGASFQTKLYECNFIPLIDKPRTDILPANTAEEEEDVDARVEHSDEDNEQPPPDDHFDPNSIGGVEISSTNENSDSESESEDETPPPPPKRRPAVQDKKKSTGARGGRATRGRKKIGS